MLLCQRMSLRLQIEAELEDPVLSGYPREYEPFYLYHATWGTNLIPKQTRSSHRAALDLTSLDLSTTSPAAYPRETIWVTLMSHTKVAGDEFEDNEEKGRVIRILESGVSKVPVLGLIQAAFSATPVKYRIVDQRSTHYDVRAERIPKGTLVLRVTYVLENGATEKMLQEYVAWATNSPPWPFSYTKAPSPTYVLQSLYNNHFGVGTHHLPLTPLLGRLHLSMYISDQGILPPVTYWMSDIYNRLFSTEPERKFRQAQYNFANESLEHYFYGMIEAQCSRIGYPLSHFIETVEYQRGHDDKLVPMFTRAVDTLVQGASAIAQAIRYMGDFRFIGKDKSYLQLDSFDSMFDMVRNGDDCEGLELLISVTLDTMKTVSAVWANNGPNATLWKSVSYVFEMYYICNSVALVALSYIDPTTKIPIDVRSVGKLPKYGGPLDKDDSDSGHMNGLLFPRFRMRKMARLGGITPSVVPAFFEKPLYPFEKELGVCVFEGTGRYDTYVIPLDQSCNGHDNPAFQGDFMRLTAASVMAKSVPEVNNYFHNYPGPFYLYSHMSKGRRLSEFYDKWSHLVCVELFKMDPRIHHLTLVNADGSYGTRTDTLLQAHLPENRDNNSLRLVAPYLNLSNGDVEKLKSHIAEVQRHIPCGMYSNFTPDVEEKTSTRLCPVYRQYWKDVIATGETITTTLFLNDFLDPPDIAKTIKKITTDMNVGLAWYRTRQLPHIPFTYELQITLPMETLVDETSYVSEVIAGKIPQVFRTVQ